MGKIRQFIILGNHIQSLGLSRMAANLNLEVTLYNSYKACVTRFSNSCKHFVLFEDEAHLIKLLMQHEDKRAILVATNDALIWFMAKHYTLLKEKFYLSIPPPDVVEICYNKIKTYKTAKTLGIPIPKSCFPQNLQELEECIQQFEYPVILKPAVMHTFHKSTGKKVFYCPDRESLLENFKEITKIIPAEEVILQEFLTGGAKTLYSFGSFHANQKVYGSFVANRIRQKPMDFGISTCFAKTVLNAELDALATAFLKGINYFGLSEVEFMYDEQKDAFKMLEINPRSWKWHSIANALDIPLVHMMVQHLSGDQIEERHNTKADVGWIERLTDTYVVLGELIKGNLTFRSYFSTLRLKKESAAWSLKDPLPALMYILLAPYLLIKRN